MMGRRRRYSRSKARETLRRRLERAGGTTMPLLVPRLRLGTHYLAGSASRIASRLGPPAALARQSLAGSKFPGGAWELGGETVQRSAESQRPSSLLLLFHLTLSHPHH